MQNIRAWLVRHGSKLAAVVIWVLIVAGVYAYMQANALEFPALAQDLRDLLNGMWFGPLLYILVYLLRPLVLFPASWLTLLAGAIFGLVPGFIYALIAGTLSSVPPYAAGRWFSAGEGDQPGEQTAQGLRRFTGLLKRNPFQSVLTLRLLFLPYDGVSLLAGALKIPFRSFFLATIIGNIGGTLAYVGVGASLEGDFSSGDIRFNPWTLALSAVILVASFAISRYLRQRTPEIEGEAQARSV